MYNMKKILFSVVVAVFALSSCGNDYLNDGGVHSNYTKHSVYDYLKGNRFHEFDSLCQIIDHYGLKEEINSCGTFFAFNDFSVRSFLSSRTSYLRNRIDSVQKYRDSIYTKYAEEGETVIYTTFYDKASDFYTWDMDSLYSTYSADDMRMYIFNEPILNNKDLADKDGMIYANQIEPMEYQVAAPVQKMAIVTQESTNSADWVISSGDGLQITTRPWYLYLVKVRGEGLDNPTQDWSDIPFAQQRPERDITVRCRTTDIISNGTVLHVLDSGHYPFEFGATYDPEYVRTQE